MHATLQGVLQACTEKVAACLGGAAHDTVRRVALRLRERRQAARSLQQQLRLVPGPAGRLQLPRDLAQAHAILQQDLRNGSTSVSTQAALRWPLVEQPELDVMQRQGAHVCKRLWSSCSTLLAGWESRRLPQLGLLCLLQHVSAPLAVCRLQLC
jgi:hypothetical protein